MKDAETGKPIVVNTDGDAGPYIITRSDQEEAVRNILDDNGYPYRIDKDGVTSGDGHSDSIINLGEGADVGAIQGLLDNAE